MNLKSFSSASTTIHAGVLQGSVLDSFLGLLYIKDIADDIRNAIKLITDDTFPFANVDNDIIAPSLLLTENLKNNLNP